MIDTSSACYEDDVSEVADERAQWPSAVAQEVHTVSMDLVKRNRARRITLSTALQRLQQLVHANLACFRARGRGGARVHDVPVGAALRALWVRTLGNVSWLLLWAFHATGDGASVSLESRLQTASGA